MKYLISVDTGGTFTDVVILDEKGATYVGKAPSTPSDFSHGILNAIDDAREKMGVVESGIVLSCGHLSAEEDLVLIDKAKKMGVEKIIVDHPHAEIIGPISFETQKEMVMKLGRPHNRRW